MLIICGLLTKHVVKMAEYWLSSLSVFMKRDEAEVLKYAKKEWG